MWAAGTPASVFAMLFCCCLHKVAAINCTCFPAIHPPTRSACRAVWYCGTACSHADRRAGHKHVCKALAAERQAAKAARAAAAAEAAAEAAAAGRQQDQAEV